MTRFQLHCYNWKDGCGSEYCALAMNRVLYRGQLPADILFIGEAPGKSENIVGVPFVKGAPAGRLLESIINQSITKGVYRIGFTNIVSCIPRLENEEKLTEPDGDQIKTCKPRLEEIISIANPRLIFAVGSMARDCLTQGYVHSTKLPETKEGSTPKVVHIVHPAFILRQSIAFRGIEIQSCCHAIRDAIHDLEHPRSYKKLPDPTPSATTVAGGDFNKLVNEDVDKPSASWSPVKRNTPPPNYGIMPRPIWDSDEVPF